MENFLSDILTTVSFKSAVYFKHGFCSPWGMAVKKGNFAQFHLLTHGSAQVYTEGAQYSLDKGDIIIFPHGDPHEIKDQPDSLCRPGSEVVQEIWAGTLNPDGTEPGTFLICGHYEMDLALRHPIFETLPACIVIKGSEYGRTDLIQSVFELIVEEMTLRKVGHEIVSLKFAEILFISIIRHYYLNQAQGSLTLFKDEHIRTALNLIHQQLNSNWSLEKLSKEVGISRTLFIERFKLAVGEPPMRYLSNWRLTKAKYLLIHTDLSLGEISEQIGYQSESAFNRVFKQKFAITPGKYRKRNLAS